MPANPATLLTDSVSWNDSLPPSGMESVGDCGKLHKLDSFDNSLLLLMIFLRVIL
jgi:hypothetical protein